MAQITGNQHHPNLQTYWLWLQQLHIKGGDAPGAEAAHKAFLKCKATGVKARDGSHKGKKTAEVARQKPRR